MSNAGYGNHDEPPPATKAANVASTKRETQPDPAEPATGSAGAKPREGAGPSGPQGDEVDPGVG